MANLGFHPFIGFSGYLTVYFGTFPPPVPVESPMVSSLKRSPETAPTKASSGQRLVVEGIAVDLGKQMHLLQLLRLAKAGHVQVDLKNISGPHLMK